MKAIIISDTSCLVVLDKINQLNLLQALYDTVIVTPTIVAEFGKTLPEWFNVLASSNHSLQSLLEETIDPGEASAIALAAETKDSVLILDDLRARKVAISLGITITGTLGVIAAAKKRGIIPAARPLFEQIRATDFRISDNFLAAILAELGE
jgi:predicted nucleic acid-binding protein